MLECTAVSSVIVNMMRDLGFGIPSWSAIFDGVETVHYLILSGTTDIASSDQQVAIEIREMVDDRDGLLRATGGALETLETSYLYLIDYKRVNGKWDYTVPFEVPGELKIYNDSSQTREPIPPSQSTPPRKCWKLHLKG